MTSNKILKIARESLRGRIRLPQGIIAFRWSASRMAGTEVMDVNGVFPFVLACVGTDPEMAADAVKSALSTQRPDGSIPAWISPDGRAASNAPAWPMLATAAIEAWRVNRNVEFLRYVLPRLAAYLGSCAAHYDPTRCGIPSWQSRDESWEPARFERGLATLDLHVFLISEINALLKMHEAADSEPADASRFRAELEALEDNMESVFWNDGTQEYADRFIGGRHARPTALTPFLLLLWSGINPEYRFQLLDRLPNRVDRLPEGKSLLSAELLLLLHALTQSRAHEEIQSFSRMLRRKLEPELADPLSTRNLFDNDVHLSALATLAETDPAMPSTVVARAAAWVGQRAPALAMTATAVLLVMGLAAAISERLFSAPAENNALMGLARLKGAYGDYDGAVRIYRRGLEEGAGAAAQLGLADMFFRKGDFDAAEKQYRALLESDRNSPLALYNLAETLRRRGKLKEAGVCFEEFIRKYGPSLPDMARTARSILDNRENP